MVVDLIEGPGRQPELQAAEGILNIARAVEGDKFVAQDGIAGPGIHRQHQGGKAGNGLQALYKVLCMGQLSAVCHQAHQHLAGNLTTAHINMPQQTLMGSFIIDGNAVVVYIIYYKLLDFVCFRRQDQAAVVLHHPVGACPEKACVRPAFFAGHGVLGLIAVAVAGGCGQQRYFLQAFAADAVQRLLDPVRLQTALLGIVHVPEVAAAAQLGHRAFPVDPVGRFFQKLGDLACRPGFLCLFNAHQAPFADQRIGDKHGAAFNFGNALSLGGVIHDHRFVNLVFCKHLQSLRLCSRTATSLYTREALVLAIYRTVSMNIL